MPATDPPPLVVAAHGTASTTGLATIDRILDRLRRERPELAITRCFLDVLPPGLAEALHAYPTAVVVPALLSTGYHVQQDIPAILVEHPAARVSAHLGPDRLLSRALRDRLPTHDTGTVALVASGSRLPQAADDLAAAAADLAELIARPVRPYTLGADLPDQLRELDHPVVATYLLAEGFFFDRLNSYAAGIAPVAPVIGDHPEVARLILRRYDAEVSARL